jgi:hypothetical protein
MVKISQKGSWDFVSNQPVYYWQDYYFAVYLASSKWGFRIKIK